MIDGLGRPIDGKGSLPVGPEARPIKAPPPPAAQRARVGRRIGTGVRALDIFAPLCEGQRLGLFAGSGVGKSVLLSMLARWTGCDVAVIGLIGDAVRYDAATSINATADYALRSVTQLKHAGIAVGQDVATVARAAYLGHHLGTGDAIRFMRGGLDSGRAKLLLDAQIGSASASQKIAHSGDASSAHRTWLLGFIERNVTPARFVSDLHVLAATTDPTKDA